MKNIFLLSFGLLLCSLITFGQMPTSPCSPSGGKKADILSVEAKYRAPGGAAPVFTIPAGTSSINVYVSSETGITSGGDNVQGDEDFINISAVIDIAGGTSSGYVNVAKNTNTDGSGTNVYGWQKVALGAYIPTASKVGDATPDLNNVNFTISGSTLTITESNTTTHSSYYVEYASPYNNSLTPLDPQVKALLHGTATANTDLVIPIPTGTNIISIMGKGTNTSYADLNTSAGTEEGYSNMRFTIDLDAGMTDGVMTLANGGAVTRRSTYVINNLSSASTMSFLSSAAITGDYSGKLTTTGAVGVSNPQIYVSGTNLVIKRDANYARDFDDAYVVEFFKRVGQGMSAEFFNSDFAFIAKGTSSASGVAKTFTIPLGTTTMYLNETGNACNTVNESNENSLAAYAYIDLNTGTATGYFYQQVGLDGTVRRDDNFAFKSLPLDGTSARNHTNTVGYKGAYGYDISFQLSADKTTLTVINKTGLANPDYQILESMDYYGARPDIAFNSTNISFAKGSSCNIVRASVEVCNPGAGNATAGMPISLYHGDPTTDPAAILLYTGTFNQTILQGECKTFTYDMDLSAFDNLDFDVTLIINDNGSFVSGGVGHAVGTPFTLSSLANQNTGFKECYFDNNLITKTMNVNNCPKANLDPDNSSGATGKYNYLNYFNAGSSGAKITDTDLGIVDYDGDNMVNAVITLTNVLDAGSEGLYINGTLPAGITATGSGTSTITLTGAASQATYIAALKLIEYRNSKSAPNTTNRIITTTLNDGTETGPASTTTIVITTDPRINVTGNGTLINDNSGTVNTVDGTDFGTVTTGTVVHTFVINNVGTGIINLTGTPLVAISGDAGFSVSAQPTLSSVTAGGSTPFTVTFNAASHTVGTYVAVVRILNNDADTGRADYSYTVMATVNNLPVVNNSTVTGLEDNTLTFSATDFTSQYLDADGTALNKIRIVTLPLNGSFRLGGVVITAGQEILASQLSNITFIPTANWNGTTSFDWRASDGTSYSTAAAKMTIVITAVNDAPVISVPTSIAVTEDIPASLKDISFADVDAGTGNVTVTFSVPDGYVSAVSGAGVTVSGTGTALVLNGMLTDINAFLVANKVTYSSSQNPPATVTLTVNINDNGNTGTGGAKQDTKTVVLGITAVNDAPVAMDDAYTVVEDTPYSGNVLSNDTDIEGNTLSASVLAGPVHGTVVLNADGSFSYTPALNYNGLDSLKYRVCDNGAPSMCDTGTVIFTVTAVNDAPVAVDDAYTVVEDTPYSGNVLSNDTDVEGNTLSAVVLTGPVHGSVVLNADGSFSYTPALNYNGLDSLKYRVCDNGAPSMCDTGTVIFTVTAVNDAPVAVDDAYTVVEDTPYPGNVLSNDTDVEGNTLSASVLAGPVHGTVVLNADGSFTYTPALNYNGLDSLKYQVCDNGTPSMCDTGTVIFTVTPVNDAPMAVDDAVTVVEDTPTDFTVLTNDTDVEGDALTATVVAAPVNGVVTQNPDGSFKYTPNANYNGLDSLKYRVCDNGTPSMCDTGTVIFTVTPVNDAPVAVDDAVSVVEDTPTDFTVLTNDTDVEGDALTATVITAPVNGVVTQNPDGSFKYTPNANYNGIDSVKYQVCDNGTPSMCDTATVIFTVTPVNDAPMAVDDAVTVVEDTPTDFTVLTNDTDVEGDALTATVVTAPVNGVVTQNPDGSFKYTPNANYNGVDSIKYQVCDNGTPSRCDTATVIFTVTPVNDAPVAVDDAVTVIEDTPTDFTVLTNDTDVEGDALTATVITAPINGVVTQNPDGSFKYTPNANYNGLDSIKYQVCDNGSPSMCDTATVIFTVTPVNDAPIAVDDAVTVIEDTPTDFTVLTNDTDVEGDALTATVITAPINGVVTQNPDGSFKYTPNANYNGLDSIKYQVCDNGTPSMCDTATVIFTVTPVNDAPVAVNDAVTVVEDTPTDFTVLTNDTDVEGDALTATVITAPVNGVVTQNPDGSFKYTPNANYNGLDSIKYQVCDNGTPSMCDTATVIFTVTPVNDAPIAVDDAVTVVEDTPTDFTVLTNDTDVEGDALTATVITAPVNGTVTQNPDGSFKYTPNANYNGLDSVKYQVCDNGTPSMCDTATVIFTVTPVNDAPVAFNDAVTVVEDTPTDFTVLTNDTDVEGDALTATVISGPVNGTVTQNPDGSFKYTPNADYNGLDSIKYQVCDNGTPSMCDTATVIFTVTPVNDAPVAVNDAVTVVEDTPTDFTVLTNDTDVEGDALTATVITAPVNGVVTQNPDGSFKYTPNSNYNGLDSVKYQVCDNGTPSMCDTATVIFTVTPVNDAPIAVDDAVTVVEDTPTDFTVLTNDTDVEGDALTATVITAPVNGTVTQNPDGSFKYTPNSNYNGLDSVKYQVCDNGTPSMCDTATVIFTVTPVNDAPVAVDDAVTVVEDTPTDFTVLPNDTDVEGDALTATVIAAPVNGAVTQNPDGSFKYTPNANYNGLDSIKYQVCDNGTPSMCDTATVIFTVTPVNDAPMAVDDAVTVVEDTPTDFIVLTNDTDVEGDALTATVVTAPVNGVVTQNPDGSFKYTPNANYNGLDSIKYQVCDNGTPSMCDTGTVIFTVTPVNDAPVAVNDAVTVVEDTPTDFTVLTNDTDVEGDALTATVITAPVNGTVTQNPDGSFKYTPNANYNGFDSIKYQVCDNGSPSMCDTATVIFTVTPVNDAPVAVDDAVTVVEDTSTDFTVLTNDTDVEGDALTATVITAPVNGVVTQNPDGSFKYTPNANYNGLDSIKYQVCDNGTPSMCDTATVIFTVTPVNDAPVAVDDAVTVVEDTPTDFTVLTNDTDVEGDALTATVITAPVNGVLTQNPDGSFKYTPNANYNGLDSLKYRVCDNGTPSMCDTGTVIFTVTPVNDAPVAVNDAVTVIEDSPTDFTVLANDTDVEGDALTATVITAPVNGVLTQNPDGSFKYTPNANYNGLDSLKYRVCDNGTSSMCDTGTVIFTVTPVNDAPVAVDDAVTVVEDTATDFTVLTNDTDVEGDALTATVITAPVNGAVTQNPDGSFKYTPNANYNGLDSIKYQVCDNGTPSMCDTGTVIFTVTPVNDAPVAVDDAVTVVEDTSTDFTVLTNDTDVEGDALTATLITAPVNGVVTQNPDGSFKYTPNANYNGLDSIKYQVCDNGTPSICDTATVIFTVTPVNDAPIAVNDAVTVIEDTPTDFTVLTNDTDVEGDALTATVINAPVNGVVTQNPDGSFKYTPNANYNGLDSIKYQVCDNGTPSMCDTGTVIFTVTPVNDAPVAVDDAVTVVEDTSTDFTVLPNDTDVEGDTLTATVITAPVNGTVTQNPDGSFKYTPNANYNGLDSIKYQVCDNGTPSMCDTATVIFTVTPVNDAPVAVNDAVTVVEDTPTDFTVLTNDTDVEGDALTATVITAPVNGVVTQNPDGSFKYTPNANYNGLDSIKYQVCDNGTPSMCDTATVIFTVTPVNDAPIAVDDAVTVIEDTPTDFTVLTNDTDVEGDALTATVITAPVNGVVTQNPDGSFKYTPNSNYNGLDSVKYQVCDNGTPSMCDTATVIFTVTPVNDAPVAVDDAVTVVEDTPTDFTVLPNDTDVEGDALTATVITAPVNGVVTQNPDGSFKYTPNSNYNGLDSLKYQVCDNGTPSMCDTATVIFTVTPINDAPVAVDDAVTVVEDSPTDFTVLPNDTDVEGDALTATVITAPVNGVVTQNPDGSFKYTPNANYNGLDSIKYQVCDNGTPSMCDTGTVIFTVTPVNDAPVAVDDAVTVVEDTPTDFTVLTNDTDVEGDALTATVITAPVNGVVTQNPDGSFKYTPNANYNGLDSIKYQVCDNGTPSMCDTAAVIFTVTPVNDAPVAVNDAVTVVEDTPTDFTVLTNDTDVEGDALTATVITAPVNGTVTQNPDGSFKYTPNANYNGLDSIKYQVCDNGTPSMCDTATVIFTVTPVNDAPIAVDDAVTVVEDTSTDFTVLTNDTDVEGDALTATVITSPINGVVTQNPDGSFKYTPNANYNGLDSIKYQVCDNGTPSMCDTATVIFTVTPVNDAPVAVDDAVTVVEDTPTDFTVLTNDTDVEGDALTATVITAPVNGVVTQNPDGSFKYTPNANYNGLDSIKYQVCDNATPSMCDSATVIFTVTPVNDAPIAVDDAVTVVEDTPTDFTVLTNDTDVEGDALTATVITAPINGTVIQNPDGSFKYIPNANYNGLDSIKYQVCDNGIPSMCDTANVVFTVTPVNDAPVAVDDAVTVIEDTPTDFTVLANDNDVEGDALTATVIAAPVNGAVTQNPDGSFKYTPNANYNGLDSIKYQVCDNGTPSMCDTATVIFTVTPVNDAPVAVNDAVTVVEDTPTDFTVLTNDTDVEGDALTATVITAPVNGVVTQNPDGSFKYTPNANYNGLDSIKYQVCDNGTPSMCDTATVTFTVTPVNDAPVAVDDAVTVVEDTPADFTVLTNDTDVEGDALTATVINAPLNGTVIQNPDGSFKYTPNSNYNGLDSIKYQVCDNGTPSMCDTATVIFTVTPVNDAPVAVDDVVTVIEDTPTDFTVLANDTDVEGDALTATVITAPVNGVVTQNPDGSFKYTPNSNYNGLDSVKYQVCDSGTPSMCDSATVIFTVTPVNDAPMAVDDAVTVVEDTPTDFTVLTNDTDVEGDALTATVITAPVNGLVTQNPDGSFKYTPNANYNGLDSIKYQVCDNGTPSMCDTATVIFTVTPVNDAPVAVDDAVTVVEDTPTDFTVLTNDTDVEGDALTATVITAPVNGVVTQNPDGSFKYTPNANYNGLDSIKYQVCDNGTPSMCDSATVIFTVTPINDAPIAIDDAVTVVEDTPTDFTVLTNDTDVEGDALTATVITAPVNGTVIQNPDGSFKYTPNANYNGLDSIKYQVCDNGTPSMCDTATVIFTVTPVNDAPVAFNDAVTVVEDTPTDFTVLTNDTDVEGDALTATVISGPVNGTVTQNPDGSFKYTPNANYNGLDSIKYQVCDNGTPSMCDTATVIFTVTPVNDAPVAVNDAVTVVEDTPTDFTVLTNDTDVEGDALTATVITAPVNGVVTQNPDGSFKYTPNSNYNGLDSIKYQVCDNGTPSMCDTATAIFTVTPVNDAPVAVNDAVTVVEDTPTDFTVQTNDTDVEGDALTATVITAPVNGTVTQNPDGSFKYTPNSNYNGLDSVKYQVCDNGTPSMCDTGTVLFTITPVNDAPTGTGDAKTTAEDTPVSGAVTGSDIDGDPLTFTQATTPAHGSAIVRPDGTYTYTPGPNYFGHDSFTITISDGHLSITVTVDITVTPVNDAPTASTQNISTTEDTPYNGSISGTDADGDALTYGPGNNPGHGTLVVNPDGTYTYTPAPNYNGTDVFTIIINDGTTTTTVTVNVAVTAVNDAPTGTDQYITVPKNTTYNAQVSGTDIDGDALTYSKASEPTHGTAVVNPDGTYTYTPASGYAGNDSFTITISDGQLTATVTIYITVTQVSSHPGITLVKTAMLKNNVITYTFTTTNTGDVALTNVILADPMVNLNTTISATLQPGEVVTQTATYTLTQTDRENQSVTNTATVSAATTDHTTISDISGTTAYNDTPTTITVPGVPKAVDDEYDMRMNGRINFNIIDNDDLGTSTLQTINILTQVKHGQLAFDQSGNIEYNPDQGYVGDDIFTYTITDADGYVSNIATVTIHIGAVYIVVPTLFTPNGDGKNDVFEIVGLDKYAENELIVVNRWGNEVYRQHNYSNTWTGDGLSEGTYYYLLRVKKQGAAEWEVFKGFTTILRKFKK